MKLFLLVAFSLALAENLTDLRSGAKLRVTHPPGLVAKYQDGSIKSSLGNFGHI